MLSEKYRINLEGFLKNLVNEDYVVVKLNTPNKHKRFPSNYKIGTDIDIIVLDKDLDRIKNKVIDINKDKKLDCLVIDNDKNIRIRYQFNGFLNLQFDLSSCNNNKIYEDCLKHSEKKDNIKIPKLKYEIALRAIAFETKPKKKHHLDFILKNKDFVDFSLLDRYGVGENIIKKIKNI